MADKTVTRAIDPRAHDLTGHTFEHLTAVRPTSQRHGQYIIWECLCQCGRAVLITSRNLIHGRTKGSCGCVRTRRAERDGREYRIWTDMRNRCNNPNNKRFQRYGARGIRVCERWNDFASFFADMGRCPPFMSIERNDNDGNYEPSNCRWATSPEQGRNNSRNRWITFNGKTMCLADWAIETGISSDAIYSRIKQLGWSVEKSLTTPLRRMKPRHSVTS